MYNSVGSPHCFVHKLFASNHEEVHWDHEMKPKRSDISSENCGSYEMKPKCSDISSENCGSYKQI